MITSAAVPSAGFAIPDKVRRWVLLAGFAGCMVSGLCVTSPWARGPLMAVGLAAGLILAIELLMQCMDVWIRRQLWRFRVPDEGQTSIRVPNASIRGPDVKRLFAHPNFDSKAAAGMRQLINWWHAPCAEFHQEVMERNAHYFQVKPVTSRILSSRSSEQVRFLARAHADEGLRSLRDRPEAWSVKRLRRTCGPMVMSFLYEFVLGRRASVETIDTLLQSAYDVTDVVRNLHGRNMAVRQRALALVEQSLADGDGRPDLFGGDCVLTLQQRAMYLLGVWFHTPSMQILRLSCGAAINVLRTPGCLERVRQDNRRTGSHAEAVLCETLRLTPGLTTTNRVASQAVTLEGGPEVARGTNVVFDLARYHRTGFERVDEFVPERWHSLDKKDVNFMPFGVGKMRCPAERFSLVVAEEMMLCILNTLELHLPTRGGLVFPARMLSDTDLCCVARRPLGRPRLLAIRCALGWAAMLHAVRQNWLKIRYITRNSTEAMAEPVHAAAGGSR